MSLAIDIDKVRRVMVGGEWFEVTDKSFTLDAYEFMWGDELQHGGGQSGVCASGASWSSPGGRMFCPLTAIQAVRY